MWLILYCLWYGCCQWCGTVKPRLNIMFHNTFRVLTNVIVLIIYTTILFLENIKCNKLQWILWTDRNVQSTSSAYRPMPRPVSCSVCARAADRPAGVHATAPATAESDQDSFHRRFAGQMGGTCRYGSDRALFAVRSLNIKWMHHHCGVVWSRDLISNIM